MTRSKQLQEIGGTLTDVLMRGLPKELGFVMILVPLDGKKDEGIPPEMVNACGCSSMGKAACEQIIMDVGHDISRRILVERFGLSEQRMSELDEASKKEADSMREKLTKEGRFPL